MRYVKQNKIYTIQEIRQENPNMSIPDCTDCSSLGFEFLEEVERPKQEGFYAIEVAPINNKQTWELIEIPKVVPPEITPLQCKLQLLEIGLLDEVEALVAADRKVQLYWEYALVIERDNEILLMITSALGMTEDEVDEFFITASKL
jgi:hypothetical protein